MIIHKENIIFIHIPKNGGTYIERLFFNDLDIHSNKNYKNLFGIKNNKALQHLTAFEIKNLFHDFDNYLKFVIIRNPYDRLISEYYWCQISGVGYKHNQSFDNFLKYVKNIVKNNRFNENVYTDHFLPQYKFIYDDNNNLLIDHIFYYENYEDVINFLNNICNISNTKNFSDVKHCNCKKTLVKKINLNESQKSIIFNLYKKDFEFFNYKK